MMNESTINLLALYESDVGERIRSYASATDLCTLDLLCTRTRKINIPIWHKLTEQKYGNTPQLGKEGYKYARHDVFLQEPVFANITEDENLNVGYGFYGYGAIAANNSIIVGVTDDTDDLPLQNQIGIYDASNIQHTRNEESPIQNKRVGICGKDGSEIIVTANDRDVCARRKCQHGGNHYHSFGVAGPFKSVHILCSEKYLIIALGSFMVVYEVKTEPVFSGKNSNFFSRKIGHRFVDRSDNDAEINDMSWKYCKSSFVVGWPDRIDVYEFNPKSDTILSLTQRIDSTITPCIQTVALSGKYIVGSCDERKINIWDRKSGNLLHYSLCDVDEEDMLNEEDIEVYGPSGLQVCCPDSCEIMISSSHLGPVLCVWNMRTGELLGRYEEDLHFGLLPNDGPDLSSMVYLEHLNGFLCMIGGLNIWSFPRSFDQEVTMRTIRDREYRLRRRLYLSDSDSDSDDDGIDSMDEEDSDDDG